MSAITVYCDESGNDGPNYLNKVSPFFVLGGWIVEHAFLTEATVAVERLRMKICPKATELKFATFKKSEGKCVELVSLFQQLLRVGAKPAFLFAEKRYCLAGKIVETFLDPLYNSRILNGFTYDKVTKQEFANTLHDCLPDTTLDRFAAAYRDPNVYSMREILDEIVFESRDKVNPELSLLLSGSSQSMPEIADAEFAAANSYEKAAGTLNFPCLVTFLMMIEHYGRSLGRENVKVVHDEQGPYQSGYHQMFLEHRQSEEFWIMPPGHSLPYSSLRSVCSFEIQRSDQQLLVQAADLLAGAVNHLVSKVSAGKQLTSAESELYKMLFTSSHVGESRLVWSLCSTRSSRIFADSLGCRGGVDEACAPAEGSLPVLPEVRKVDDPTPRLKVTLPVYFIVRRGTSDSVVFDETPAHAFIPAFTEKGLAEDCLTQYFEPSIVEVLEYDVQTLPKLINDLNRWDRQVRNLRINPTSDVGSEVLVRKFAGEMSKIVDRTKRLIASGICEVVQQEHVIGGRKALTLLLSSGFYAASWLDDTSKCETASTRDGALEKLT